MRFVLVAALAIAGCYKNPGTSTPPANKAAAPDYRATADDVLGFLPIDADLVVGVDVALLRQTPLWHAYEPMILQVIGNDLEKFRKSCGFDPLPMLERVTVALKETPNDKYNGVLVVRGLDSARVLDCLQREVQSGGGKVVNDRGVVVVSEANAPGTMAVAAVAPTTLVVQFDAVTSHDSMEKVLTSGASLRKSPVFMMMFDRRETTAQLWLMLNGNSQMMKQLNPLNVHPKGIDATLTVTDRMALAGRIRMAEPNEAVQVQTELDKVKGMLKPLLDRFDTRLGGDTVQVDVVATDNQLKTIAGMLGGAFGP